MIIDNISRPCTCRVENYGGSTTTRTRYNTTTAHTYRKTERSSVCAYTEDWFGSVGSAAAAGSVGSEVETFFRSAPFCARSTLTPPATRPYSSPPARQPTRQNRVSSEPRRPASRSRGGGEPVFTCQDYPPQAQCLRVRVRVCPYECVRP